jgi:hypothetical protein
VRALAGAVLIVSVCAAAFGAELPQYDIDASCKRAAASTGNAEDGIRRICLLMEQQRAKEIASHLDTIDPEALSRCAAQAQGSGSYIWSLVDASASLQK